MSAALHMGHSLGIHSPTHICMDDCMKINSPAHDLHIFIRFSPNLNSLTLKVVGQWSHFSPILPSKRSFVINTVVKKKRDTPSFTGHWLYPMVVLGWLGGLRI